MWYCILFGLYVHLIVDFQFPKSIDNASGLIALGVGYAAFFTFAAFINLYIFSTGAVLAVMFREMRKFRNLIGRISTVFSVYLGVDLIFAALYRLISQLNPNAFDPPLTRTIDAIYFSTVTITTLGYGDIKPTRDNTKLLVIAELLIGVVLLAAVLATAISISLEKKKSYSQDRESTSKHDTGV